MSNKRVLFITKINFGNKQNAGYLTKVRAQSEALRSHGLNVDLLYLKENMSFLENPEITIQKTFYSRISLLYYMFAGFPLSLSKNYYSGIYIRHFLSNPFFLICLLLHKFKGSLIIMEVPTYPYSFEYKQFKNKIKFWIDQICSWFFRFFISKIVTFSFDKKIFGISTINTDNGVEVKNIPFQLAKPPFTKVLHLLGLGNPRTWHAYERIIEGMASHYRTNPEVKVVFDMVGQGGEITKYQNLVQKHNLAQFVNFHGFKTGAELDKICNSCHIAVASLGMHRINVSNGEASPLKAREFAARGIPFITGYLDKGFPKDFPFILNFPSDESTIDIAKTIAFYFNLLETHPNYKSEMRTYAEKNLDWTNKMQPIAKYFNNH